MSNSTQTAQQINLPQTGAVVVVAGKAIAPALEFPFTEQPGCKELPLVPPLAWRPVTQPPAGDGAGRIYCVSTPTGVRPSELAYYLGGKWLLRADWQSGDISPLVTFWTELPATPEEMAAHPEKYLATDKHG